MDAKTFKNLTLDSFWHMNRQSLLDWKKNFQAVVSNWPNQTKLEPEFETSVNSLSEPQLQTALGYLELWENGKTDAEKIYFSRKTIESIFTPANAYENTPNSTW